jgi:hypothetical protein
MHLPFPCLCFSLQNIVDAINNLCSLKIHINMLQRVDVYALQRCNEKHEQHELQPHTREYQENMKG